jgi:ribonuclease D
MIDSPLSEPVWVARPADLHRMVKDLSRFARLAVDTESNGLYVYQEQVCLLQFSTGETDYLVDPLALADLSILEPIFTDPAIEKIFHAAEYDILCLKRDFGFHFANLFDTMLAARILGRKELGLGGLLGAEFQLDLNKRFQRANWGRRPLPPGMLTYARLDTHYLIALRDRLYALLEEKDLLPLADEDFRRLCDLPAAPHQPEPDTCWHLAGPREVTPRQAAVLQELVLFRDRQARYANLPPFKILSNHTLVEIAQRMPGEPAELEEIPGIPASALERFGPDLLGAVERGQRAPLLYPPRNHRPPEEIIRRIEKLRSWRKELGREKGVESDIILPRDLVNLIAERNPRTPTDLAEVMRTTPWRLEHFGAQILNLLTSKGKKTA